MFGKLTVSIILLFSVPEGGELAWILVEFGVRGVVKGVNRGDDLKMGEVIGEQSTPIILGRG